LASVPERRRRGPAERQESVMAQSPNRILNALPQNIFAAMEPHLRDVTLAFGDFIAETGAPVANVYFPFTGVVSLVAEIALARRRTRRRRSRLLRSSSRSLPSYRTGC
jgi:hypothetical protein